MTRINCTPVEELTDKHLLAEDKTIFCVAGEYFGVEYGQTRGGIWVCALSTHWSFESAWSARRYIGENKCSSF